jgi:AcrR family transcriptional regulator
MIELSAKHGYHSVTITELCSFAGVSPATYYEQFSAKEDCFLARRATFFLNRTPLAPRRSPSATTKAALASGLRGLGRPVCRAFASPTPWSAAIAGAGFEPATFGL